MPLLNFTNPLYSFGGTNTSYTCVKECYLVGVLHPANGDAKAMINGTIVLSGYFTPSEVFGTSTSGIRLQAGDVVTLSGVVAGTELHILEPVS